MIRRTTKMTDDRQNTARIADGEFSTAWMAALRRFIAPVETLAALGTELRSNILPVGQQQSRIGNIPAGDCGVEPPAGRIPDR
jgi:hypothetical protein